ncbi:protein toll-like [Plodia interpunctella]|uniref:protein toll-like n=1 Tax=Plodia interpunctella TaxID=58824 RepID=UPI002368724D|nr:protein toll-like [Plodia interpunctella]XP_053622830.1 protein toll-like [Plodia interpunctella]XP_053622831.1 protein toll-like [Plodia interpunctella]
MLAPLMVLASLSLAFAARSCPSQCATFMQFADGREGCECPAGNGTVTVYLSVGAVEIVCLDNLIDLRCSDIPEIPRFGSLTKLKVTDCGLNGPLKCWLGKLGVKTIDTLVLSDVKTPLEEEHIVGLVDIHTLRMYYASAQRTLPVSALTALPNLREFRIRGANISSPSPLRNLPLTYLEVSGEIQHLADGAFELKQLEFLQLFGNGIVDVKEDNFKGLSSLKNLNLDHNKISRFPLRVFSNMPRLVELSFVDNAVKQIDSEAFYGLRQLKTIIAFNNAAQLNLAPLALANLPSLENLKLDNCQIPNLPSNLFTNSTKLKNISLKENKIINLPEGIFKDQQLLATLDLSGNMIDELPDRVFSSLGSLVELNLDGNNIARLPGEIFNDLTNLQSLRVNNNQLSHIADTAMTRALSLKHISLSNNKLSFHPDSNPGQYFEIPQSPFRMLHRTLEYLDLSGNNVTEILEDWKLVLIRVKTLNLSRNGITELADTDTQFISNQTVIDLRHNKITKVVLNNPFFIPKGELKTETLHSTILLDDNPFVCDCLNENFFSKLHNNFPYYNIIPKFDTGRASCVKPSRLKGELVDNIDPSILTCRLEENCPEGCSCDIRPSTKHIELTCNDIPKSLPDPLKYRGYEVNSTELTLKSVPSNLDLPNHVDRLILRDLHLINMLTIPDSVIYLDLTNNDLFEIPTDVLMRNITVLLSGNPFLCDCGHDDAVAILQSYKNNILDGDTVRCENQQSPWPVDVPRLCSVQRAAILGGSLAVLSIILIIIAGLYYRYSLQIKIFIYSCEKLRWLIAEEDIDKDRKYDAFISFSHKDEKFVAEKLIPVLESGSRPFKLCVHYRDWIVGEWIPAQIASSVEQSRRTIIVLSRSFVESVWGTMEFRVAHKRAQEEKMTRIVVILLEDAPPDGELDAELRAYLSTNTYVKWGDPWFWEKLRYALAGGRVGAKPKPEKKPKSVLNVRLNSSGQLVNDTKDYLV